MKKKYNSVRLSLWLLILCMLTAGAVLGKYVTTREATGEQTVTFTATLAQSVLLQESVVARQDDGTYVRTNTLVTVKEAGKPDKIQNYTLMPGVDIPKDPHVVVTGKSNIPAYLFIEVVDTSVDDALIYEVNTDVWQETTLKNPDHGGKMYVYTVEGKPAKLVADPPNPIYILRNNTVEVGQKLLTKRAVNALTFYVYLEEPGL